MAAQSSLQTDTVDYSVARDAHSLRCALRSLYDHHSVVTIEGAVEEKELIEILGDDWYLFPDEGWGVRIAGCQFGPSTYVLAGGQGEAGYGAQQVDVKYTERYMQLLAQRPVIALWRETYEFDPVQVDFNTNGSEGLWMQCGIKVAVRSPGHGDYLASPKVCISFSSLQFGVHDCKDTDYLRGYFPESFRLRITPPNNIRSSPEVQPWEENAITKHTSSSSTAFGITGGITNTKMGLFSTTATSTNATGQEQQLPSWACHAVPSPGKDACWQWELKAWESGAAYNFPPHKYGPGLIPKLPFTLPGTISVPTPQLTATWVLESSMLGKDLEWNVEMQLDATSVEVKPVKFITESLGLTFGIRSSSFSGKGVACSFSTPLPCLPVSTDSKGHSSPCKLQ